MKYTDPFFVSDKFDVVQKFLKNLYPKKRKTDRNITVLCRNHP